MITSVEPGKLLQLEAQAKDSPLPPLHSLTQYWRIDAQGLRQPLKQIVQRLSRLDAVELAYPELAVFDPDSTVTRPLASPVTRRLVSTVTRLLTGKQGYLDAAPKGIDARWAWKQPGGTGQRVGMADIERGWVLNHEALVHSNPTMIQIPPPGQPGDELINEDGFGAYRGHHGTHVLGVIAAYDNPPGIMGIAPSLRPDGPGACRCARHPSSTA